MRLISVGFFLVSVLGVTVVYGERFTKVYDSMSRQASWSPKLRNSKPAASQAPDAQAKTPPAQARNSVEGLASVIDGNTLDVGGVRIALLKYRACALGQAAITAKETFDCGQWAKDGLANFANGQHIRCIIHSTDKKSVSNADCVTADNQDIGILMIRDGYGMPNKNYPASPKMRKAAADAQAKQLGIWSFENLKKS